MLEWALLPTVVLQRIIQVKLRVPQQLLLEQTSNTKTLQYITNARQLLNQTFDAYQKQNYTGALALATKAYLDNFEFVEGPVQQHDKTLKQNTEFMMRGDLRGQIKHKVPVDDIKTLIGKINTNLDKAEKLLSSP